MSSHTLRLSAVALALLPLTAGAVHAQRGASTVTACSLYGRGCLTAPVRRGSVETQVRMPGGTWIGCKRDCRETLREEALDFFETLRDRAGDSWR